MNRRDFFNKAAQIMALSMLPIFGSASPDSLDTKLTKSEIAPIAETQTTGDWFLGFLKTELSGTYDETPYSKIFNRPRLPPEENSLSLISNHLFYEVHYSFWIDVLKLMKGQPIQRMRPENTTPEGGAVNKNVTNYSNLTDYLKDEIKYIGEKALAGTNIRWWLGDDAASDGTPLGREFPSDILQYPFKETPALREKMDIKGNEIIAKYLAHDCKAYMAEQGKMGKPITELDFVNYLDFKKHYPMADQLTAGSGEVNRHGYIVLHNLAKVGMVPYLQKEGIALK